MTIRRVTSPDVAEPPPERWSNCLVVDGVAYVSGMTARGADPKALGAMDEYAQAKAIFGKIGSSLSSKEFYAAAGAIKGHDKDDRIVYDTSTGKLYYDADGSKAGAKALHIATLAGAPLLDHGDFAIV